MGEGKPPQQPGAQKPPMPVRAAPPQQSFKLQVAAAGANIPVAPLAPNALRQSFPAAPTSPRLSQVRRVSAPPPAPKTDPWRKETAWNWSGCSVYTLFICAYIFYYYVRIRYTLHGGLLAYAIVILIFEFISSSAMVVHGLSLLRRRVPRRLDPASPPPPREYIIRVLIPCYTESLTIVKEVVLAAADALLPEKCKRTVYVLDDGKDTEKAAWVAEQGRDDIVYRSGRVRSPGETNGKACNLNNTLHWLYPKEKCVADEELLVIFDADMICSPEFFTKICAELYDPQVALVLTPQAFHNYDPTCDIFNHSNLIYWQISLPGLDGWNNVSCTGTNFVVRARAAQEAGFFPSYTLGEDMALALEIQKAGWKGAYVKEYMAVGEVPETVRNAFMQKSRWCKGGMQIFFSHHNAIFHKNISFMQKILWNTSGLAYISATVTTPVFLVVPIIGVWAGFFPLEFSWWFALAFTIYSVASHLLLYYCHDIRHMRSIYFSICAAHVLWFAYAKATFNTLIAAIMKREIKFKTTEKTVMAATVTDQANKAKSKGKKSWFRTVWTPVQDIWMHCIVLVVSLATAAVGIVRLVREADFKQIQTISILVSVGWCFYNSSAPFLLLWHKLFNNRGLTLLVNFWAFASSAIVLMIVVIIWVILPTEYNYGQLLSQSYDFYLAQRSGYLGNDYPISWRGDSGLTDVSASGTSLVGGYYDNGGMVKYSFPLASTVALLAWGLLEFPQGYKSAGVTNKALSALRQGTDYMLKCNLPASFGSNFAYVAQVGDFSTDAAYYGKPEQFTGPRNVSIITASNPGSDLLGSTAAALAASAMVFKPTDSAYAAELATLAVTLYNAGAANLGYYSVSVPDAALLYDSHSYYDDLAWGALWLHKLTGNAAYLDQGAQYFQAQLPLLSSNAAITYVFNYDNVLPGAAYLLAEATGFKNPSYVAPTEAFLASWIKAQHGISRTPKFASWVTPNGALANEANAGLLAWIYHKHSGAGNAKYTCWGEFQMRYMLGDGHTSFVVGEKDYPKKPAHKGASCAGGPNVTCPTGSWTAATPNPHVLTGALVNGPQQPNDLYVDSRQNNGAAVSIAYNAGYSGMLAALTEQGKRTFTHCTQSHGFIYILGSNLPF